MDMRRKPLAPSSSTPRRPVEKRRSVPMDKTTMFIMEANEISNYLKKPYVSLYTS